jgi:hypothetical protein
MRKNNELRYFLIKYIPVYSELGVICIGYVNDKNRYIEVENTDENYKLIEKVLKFGISKEELEDKIQCRLVKDSHSPTLNI